MITIPIFDMMILPGVTVFFQKRYFYRPGDNSRACGRGCSVPDDEAG